MELKEDMYLKSMNILEEQGWKKLTCVGIHINDILRDIQGENKVIW